MNENCSIVEGTYKDGVYTVYPAFYNTLIAETY
jgi:hypothetical protein